MRKRKAGISTSRSKTLNAISMDSDLVIEDIELNN